MLSDIDRQISLISKIDREAKAIAAIIVECKEKLLSKEQPTLVNEEKIRDSLFISQDIVDITEEYLRSPK